MQYRPEIDGLRTVAVVPVLLFHAHVPGFSGGFVGVDVFFVISGVLITGILLEDLDRGRFSLVSFYERRMRRILPALFAVILACVPFAWAWMLPDQIEDFAKSVFAVGFFVSNILFWRQSGYFDAAAEEKPLLHTWSLAVEEQYYIAFPLLLFLLWPRGRGLTLLVLVSLALASLALSEWGARHAPQANFYLAPSRIWELLAGSLCAIAMRHRSPPPSQALSLLGLAMIVAAVVLFDKTTPFPSVFTLLPVIGTCLVVLHARPGTWAQGLLALRPMVGLGLVSYSLYLWHQPILAFARIRAPELMGTAHVAWMLGLSLLLAILSWRFVERPFRARTAQGFAVSRRRIFQLSFGVTAALAVASLPVATGIGWRGLYLAPLPPEQARLIENIETATRQHRAHARGRFDDGACVFDARRIDPQVIARLRECRARHGPGLLVLGDSHGIDIFGTLVAGGTAPPFLFAAVSGGCRPHDAGADCQYAPLRDLLAGTPDLFEAAIFTQAGFYLLRNARGAPAVRADFTQGPSAQFARFTPDAAAIGAVRAYLEDLAVHLPVIWLGPRVEPHVPMATIARLGCGHDFALRPDQGAMYATLDAAVARALDGTPVRHLSQQALVDLTLPGDLVDCAALYFSDGDHYSAAGEARFGARMNLPAAARALMQD